MPYRNKTYVCFDGDEDMRYYRLMTAWKANDNLEFDFHDAHDLNTARDTSLEESIKKQLRERFSNSKLLIVLIGEKTKGLTKFVKWEMEVALRLGLPIVGVNLNGSRQRDDRCPPTIRGSLSVHVPFSMKAVSHAIDNWPASHATYLKNGQSGPFTIRTRHISPSGCDGVLLALARDRFFLEIRAVFRRGAGETPCRRWSSILVHGNYGFYEHLH